jgi:anti-sigma factor RsiW
VLRGAGTRQAGLDGDGALSRQGYQITHWQAAGMDYWAVTDGSTADLQCFRKAWRTAGGSTQ